MAVPLPEEIARARLMVDSLAATAQRRPQPWLQRDLARWQRRLARLETVRTEAQRRVVA